MSTIRELMKLSSSSKDLEKLIKEDENQTDPHVMLVNKVNKINCNTVSENMNNTNSTIIQTVSNENCNENCNEKCIENIKNIENNINVEKKNETKELPTLKELHNDSITNKGKSSELTELITKIQNNNNPVIVNTKKNNDCNENNKLEEWKICDITNKKNKSETPVHENIKPTSNDIKEISTGNEQSNVTKNEQHKEMEIEPIKKRLRKNIKKVEHEIIDTQISKDSEDGDSIGSEDTYSDDTSDSEDTYNYNDEFINDDTISMHKSNENSMSEMYESDDISTTREFSEEDNHEKENNEKQMNKNDNNEQEIITEPIINEKSVKKNKLQRLIANTMKNKLNRRSRMNKRRHSNKENMNEIIHVRDESIDVDSLKSNEINEISSENSKNELNDYFINIDDIEPENSDESNDEWQEKPISMKHSIRKLKNEMNNMNNKESNNNKHEHGKILIKRKDENRNECKGINKYLRLGSILNKNFIEQNDLRQFDELECNELNKSINMNKTNNPYNENKEYIENDIQNNTQCEYNEKEINNNDTCKELEEKIQMMQNLLKSKRKTNSEVQNNKIENKRSKEYKPKHSDSNKENNDKQKKNKMKKVIEKKINYKDFQPESDDGIDFRNFLHNVHIKRNQIINKVCVWLNEELNNEKEIKESDIIAYLQIKNKITDEHYDI